MENQRILIADDEKEMRKLIVACLINFNVSIDFVANGLEAFNQIKMNPYDLVISDYDMPIMNGLELIQKIKTMNPSLPILIVSAQGPVKDLLKSGATACLTKPFHVRDLQATVKDILKKSIYK